MNQNEIQLDEPLLATSTAKLSLGDWLIKAREAQGLSAQDVASRTNRGLHQVMAIEANDYSSVNAPILLRAFVRHYAKAVGIDADEAVTHIPEQYQQVPTPTHTRDAQLGKVFTHNGTPLKSPWISRSALALLALAVLGLLGYWIFGTRFLPATDSAKKTTEPNQVQVTAPVVVPPVVAPAPVEVAPPVVDDMVLKFKADSWVEIRDADNQILLSGAQTANTEQTVTGKLPWKVKIGNATNVEATWRGAAHDLTPSIKGGVARFTLE